MMLTSKRTLQPNRAMEFEGHKIDEVQNIFMKLFGW